MHARMCEVDAEGSARLLEQRSNEFILQTKREHPHYNLSGLGSCRKWQSFEVAAISRRSSLHFALIYGSHRCHAVVLEGRISVLGGGGGVAELSRTIFGRTSWLRVWR
jgi:hypothetical protein